MARPKVHTGEVRDRLVSIAVETLAESGMSALSVRGIAQAAGTSTTAVYSLFGSKEALARAAVTSAFESFGAAQESATPVGDIADELAALGARYVAWALEHPQLFELMFGRRAAGIEPDDALLEVAARSIAPLSTGVRHAVEAGVFRPEDPETIVASLWSQVHGMALLMLGGHWPPAADPVRAATAVVDGWRTL